MRILVGIFFGLYASIFASADHKEENEKRLTVGCAGKTCNLDLNSIGLFETCLKPWRRDERLSHSHPGITIDLNKHEQGEVPTHSEADFLTHEFADVFDTIFFERLDPLGISLARNPIHNDIEFKNVAPFFSKCLAKAKKILRPGGNLIILLAIDITNWGEASKEVINQFRQANPFIGSFNNSVTKVLEKPIKNTNPFRQELSMIVKKYKQYMDVFAKEELERLSNGEEFEKKLLEEMMGIFYKNIDCIDDPYSTQLEPSKQNDLKKIHLNCLEKIIFVKKQGPMMREMLERLGFTNVEIKWMTPLEQEWSPTSGYFVTAKAPKKS